MSDDQQYIEPNPRLRPAFTALMVTAFNLTHAVDAALAEESQSEQRDQELADKVNEAARELRKAVIAYADAMQGES